MIEWITNWTQGIIVAVIIATIIEMILPEGNCKKYIKVVIGVYVLFSIVSPVITKITNKNFNISEEFNLEEFSLESGSKSTYNELDANNSNNIKDIYISNLKTDIKSKLKNKDYNVISCSIEVKDEKTYEIKKLVLEVEKIPDKDNEENTVSNVTDINQVNIQISANTQTTTKSKKSELTTYETKELKEFLRDTYEIKKENIYIN